MEFQAGVQYGLQLTLLQELISNFRNGSATLDQVNQKIHELALVAPPTKNTTVTVYDTIKDNLEKYGLDGLLHLSNNADAQKLSFTLGNKSVTAEQGNQQMQNKTVKIYEAINDVLQKHGFDRLLYSDRDSDPLDTIGEYLVSIDINEELTQEIVDRIRDIEGSDTVITKLQSTTPRFNNILGMFKDVAKTIEEVALNYKEKVHANIDNPAVVSQMDTIFNNFATLASKSQDILSTFEEGIGMYVRIFENKKIQEYVLDTKRLHKVVEILNKHGFNVEVKTDSTGYEMFASICSSGREFINKEFFEHDVWAEILAVYEDIEDPDVQYLLQSLKPKQADASKNCQLL